MILFWVEIRSSISCNKAAIFICSSCVGSHMEKPRDFDPFGQAGLSPLATI